MKNLWRIIRFTKQLWPLYWTVSIFSVLLAISAQVQPLLIKRVIDEVAKLSGGGQASIRLAIICGVLIFLADWLGTMFSNIGGYYGDVLQNKMRKFLSERYYEHLLQLPQAYFDSETSGKIINRLNRSIDQVVSFTHMFSNNFLQFIFSTVLSLAIVFVYSWQVGLLLLSLYPIFIWLTTRTSAKWQEYQGKINEQYDEATGRFAEVIGQVKVTKSFGGQARELKLFSKRYEKAIENTYPQSRLWHKQDIIRRTVLNVIFFLVYAWIFLETVRGNYTLGTMVLLIQYATSIRIPIFSISFLVDQSQRAVANSREYFEAMDVPAERRVHATKQLATTENEVKFTEVNFAYEDKKPVLQGLSFTLRPNTSNALVGESGEGKTTVTNLLLGLYQPTSGVIEIDGQDTAEVSAESLHQHVGVVFQDAALFSGTVYENIAYGRPKATQAEVERVARAANAEEFIRKLPDGYQTKVGERGLKLSGGQKQRIAIARALLKDAPILVLDEATSSLDTRSERLVHEALEKLMKGRTTLLIAHRLSTIASVDNIITLKGGVVDEVGSPAELAKSGGIYAQLLALQSGADKVRKKELTKYELKG